MSDGEPVDQPTQTWRPRVSLLNVLLLITIVAMGIALWRLGREVVPLREEVARLRDEAGYINLGDPNHVHAVRIRTTEKPKDTQLWRWKVYVPGKGKFYLHCWPFDVPEEGVPPRVRWRGGGWLMPGEHVFEMRITKHPDKENQLLAHLQGRSETNVHGSKYEIRERRQKNWIAPHEESGRWQMIGRSFLDRQTISSPPEEPLVLLRLRAGKVSTIVNEQNGSRQWDFQEAEGICDGLILWVSNYEK